MERNGATVTVEAEGLSLSFDGALVESTDEALFIIILPADAGE